jgi:glycosyltransferase involved in cell wall biosynthesis
MDAFGVGGTIRATFTTAGELAKRHDVEVVSVLRSAREPALPPPPGVRLRWLTDSEPRGVRRWAAGRPSRLMIEEDIRFRRFSLLTDAALVRFLLSVHDGVLIGTRPNLNVAIARLASPAVVRVGQDHLNLRTYRPALQEQLRRAYQRLDVVSSLTKSNAKAFRRLLRRRTRVVCVPNGIPLAGRPRAALDDKVVIAAGRLSNQKGFDRLLRVWKTVSAEHPDWELRIFGTGRMERWLKRRITRLGIGDSARLMGFTPRLDEELAAASVYVMTSRLEGFPMVLLEAMSAGLPVVSFDCPTGPREIIRDGVNGHLVRNGDRKALAAALSGLMADAERRKAYGAAAVERAADYDIVHIAERWEALLGEVAAAKQPGRTARAGPVVGLLLRTASGRVRRLTRRVRRP